MNESEATQTKPEAGQTLAPTACSAAGVIDTEHRDNPICPYCGHLRKDAWEINFGPGIEGWNEITCGNCEKEYFVERHCTVSYSTRKLPNNQAPPRRDERTET